jgi:hypothetical protein
MKTLVNHRLYAGFAKATVIITMDADLQDSPEEIRVIQYDYLPKL